MNNEQIILPLKEGSILNYIEILMKHLGGEHVNKRYVNRQGGNQIQLSYYSIMEDFELVVTQSSTLKSLVIDRKADERRDYYHFNIVKEGQVIQEYNSEQKYMDADTPRGIFIYNGLFPLKTVFPARATFRSIAFKVSKPALRKLFPEAVDIIESQFSEDEAKGYHMHISADMDRLIKDIFNCEEKSFARIPLMNAKGLELFVVLITSVRQLSINNELHGLHLDDYKRLLIIKDELIKSVEGRISLESIAEQHAISVSKLQRDFKTLYNCSVYQFFTHVKMDEAYRRLNSGAYSVMEVGYDLGYSSIPQFSQMFKKIKGISPKEAMPQ
ncbi:helix-turn-helix domain-containing protein [Carboxylicivirga sp. RSCT41]|uniref:helix-turn-helix domain-containing protein n=1 Tax=Carboxylicivirga agarovorans TaxID=3417570 RepID=UPI003D351BD9